ncbi:IBR domain, E3 ubiquitin-protein ligase RNF8, E3 ubiquitin ligase RBR family [Artemisia annua]|uniref:RBR-type E3 ubiquitin transferase n=1 Tax=Artemisia annua TaxID=35608 RepID=A0A2U1NTK8_ARTAN|nr:IBR domain, E3 ubiquitin-protein ligase RNF8, E3 ubiquitin ligase RBR family [Artemisia annua]
MWISLYSMCNIILRRQVRLNNIFKNGHKYTHQFCTNCMSRYIQGKLDDNFSDITCPATTCSRPLDPLSCCPILTYQLFNTWCDKLCEAAVSLVERVYCPNNECSELFLSECDDNPNRCECPSWDQPFCFECKVARHNGYSCAEIQEMRCDNDVALRALCKAKKWQRCPKCRHVVEHISGYNHIMCIGSEIGLLAQQHIWFNRLTQVKCAVKAVGLRYPLDWWMTIHSGLCKRTTAPACPSFRSMGGLHNVAKCVHSIIKEQKMILAVYVRFDNVLTLPDFVLLKGNFVNQDRETNHYKLLDCMYPIYTFDLPSMHVTHDKKCSVAYGVRLKTIKTKVEAGAYTIS